jgi:Ribonuclease T2 family
MPLRVAAAVTLIFGGTVAAPAGSEVDFRGLRGAAAQTLPIANAQAPGAAANSPGNFDFYVFSLSWSPSFCETPAAERARGQCETGANLGFVVHGLWPQYARGFPSDCSPAGRVPSRIALEGARDLYPSLGLARHEWAKHGTCSGKSPTDYFADVRRARDTVARTRGAASTAYRARTRKSRPNGKGDRQDSRCRSRRQSRRRRRILFANRRTARPAGPAALSRFSCDRAGLAAAPGSHAALRTASARFCQPQGQSRRRTASKTLSHGWIIRHSGPLFRRPSGAVLC